MSKEWDCPRCGQKTSGSYSGGGALWAICDSCMTKEIESYRLAEVEKKEKEEDRQYVDDFQRRRW